LVVANTFSSVASPLPDLMFSQTETMKMDGSLRMGDLLVQTA
jgi:hypothetical protein